MKHTKSQARPATPQAGDYTISCFSLSTSSVSDILTPPYKPAWLVASATLSLPLRLRLCFLPSSVENVKSFRELMLSHDIQFCAFSVSALHGHPLILSFQMGDRLLTETTIPSTVDEASIVDSSTVIVCDGDKSSVHEVVENGRSRSGVLVECRICQEEEDEFCMEIPCSCKGSLKYAHHKCIQRWCNEKGDTICEICLQQFTPNYTAPFKLFQHGRNPIHFSNRERLETLDNGHIQPQVVQTTDQTAATSTSYDHQGVIYCRIIAITLMVLLVLRDALSVIQSDPDVYSVAIITLLMLRTAGIVIPVYIILISVTASLHSCNRQQAVQGGGTESLQPVPRPRQHIISIR